jgi:pyruvate/2-oxoglutarate dehydrogenase complex dihydrolipoamide dehydrogenase (E3) component
VEREPDLLVLGGAAAGIAAARTGVRLGARTVLVERSRIGGDCTFTGCVPSKAFIEAARRGASFSGAMAAARRAVEAVAATEDDAVLAAAGVEVIHGSARFCAPGLVAVDGTTFRPRRTVIATGAGPAVPPIPGLAQVAHLTNETLFGLEAAPASLVVLGGGAIGCEMAQAIARTGVPVTLVELLGRLLPREEPDASATVRTALAAAGVDVRTARRVTEVVAGAAPGWVRVCLDDGEAVDAGAILVATGRTPATGELGLETAGVLTEAGAVVTDDTLATTAPGVFAAGDVTGRVQFTHAADEMGRIAATNALRRRAFSRSTAGTGSRGAGRDTGRISTRCPSAVNSSTRGRVSPRFIGPSHLLRFAPRDHEPGNRHFCSRDTRPPLWARWCQRVAAITSLP